VGPRVVLNGRKISSPPGFDPGPSSSLSGAIPAELPGPRLTEVLFQNSRDRSKANHEEIYGIASVRMTHTYNAWKKPV